MFKVGAALAANPGLVKTATNIAMNAAKNPKVQKAVTSALEGGNVKNMNGAIQDAINAINAMK